MTNRINLETIEREFNSTRKYHSATLKNGEEIRYYMKFSEAKIKSLKLLKKYLNKLKHCKD